LAPKREELEEKKEEFKQNILNIFGDEKGQICGGNQVIDKFDNEIDGKKVLI